MAYAFDDASSQSLSRAPFTWASMSIWFYPDDSALDCILYSDFNTAGTRYIYLRIQGSSDDKIILETNAAGSITSVSSGGTVNYNAWNHVYAARGISSPTSMYISLNGETLQTGTYTAPGTVNTAAIGRKNLDFYFSGMAAECAFWDNCLNDFDDRYRALALGYDPRLIPQDTGGSAGLGALTLIAYSPLIGNPRDWVRQANWTVGAATVAASDHPRIRRNFME